MTTITRNGREICAEFDQLREERDAYARVTAKAVLDGDPLVNAYAAEFARLNVRLTEVLEQLRHHSEGIGIPITAITSAISWQTAEASDDRVRANGGESL